MKTNIEASLLQSATQTAETKPATGDKAALKKSCQDFEAIFVQSLFKAMRKTIPQSGLFAKSNATEIFQDMLDQGIATNVSRKQSLGLAEQMYRQMSKNLPTEK